MLLLVHPSGVTATTLLCHGPCGKRKPDEDFGSDKTRTQRRGRDYLCRECRLEWRRQPGECVECGGPTTSRYARFCLVHRPTHMSALQSDYYFDRFGHMGQWTPERVIEEVHRFVRERGRLPRQADWRKGRVGHVGLGGRARRTWPPLTTVYGHFGSFNAAIEAAGYEPRPPGNPGNKNGETCRNGLHPWVPENIYVAPDGIERCRECRREADLRHKERRRKAAGLPKVTLPLTTTCWNGKHAWVPENVVVDRHGGRRCRACRQEAYRRYREKKRKLKAGRG